MAEPPRPIRNHNPGDLRYSPLIPWKGLADPPQDEGGYCVFRDDEPALSDYWGFRALARDLHTKWKEGFDTIREIVTRFAPQADNNDTEAYIAGVCGRTGWLADDPRNFDDAGELEAAVHAFTHEEYSASNRDTVATVNHAVADALGIVF